jgi:hypothetical protein
MSKRIDHLRRVVGKFKRRYGEQDEDARRLQLELDALVTRSGAQVSGSKSVASGKYSFQTLAKQQYYAARRENQY